MEVANSNVLLHHYSYTHGPIKVICNSPSHILTSTQGPRQLFVNVRGKRNAYKDIVSGFYEAKAPPPKSQEGVRRAQRTHPMTITSQHHPRSPHDHHLTTPPTPHPQTIPRYIVTSIIQQSSRMKFITILAISLSLPSTSYRQTYLPSPHLQLHPRPKHPSHRLRHHCHTCLDAHATARTTTTTSRFLLNLLSCMGVLAIDEYYACTPKVVTNIGYMFDAAHASATCDAAYAPYVSTSCIHARTHSLTHSLTHPTDTTAKHILP